MFALVDYETREVRSRVVANVTGRTLLPAIQEQVDMGRTMLHTDGAKSYRIAAPHMLRHEYVTHEAGEYVRDGVSTNLVEGFFSQLKRSIDGTHHHVSDEHLHRYLAEFDYRYSTCQMTDSARMRRVVRQVTGRRLSYKPLTER